MTTRMADKKQNSNDAMRKCIATGELCPKSELSRFVLGPDGSLVFDVLCKLPGRGMWVRSDREALKQAISKNAFARSAKAQVRIPEGLLEQIEAALVARVISLVALARKSGNAVTGATKVKDWVSSERAVVLFQASDGSEREKSKIRLRNDGRCFDCLSKEELGQAFGREFAVHAALDAGGLASRVIEDATRLEGLRPPSAEKRRKG